MVKMRKSKFFVLVFSFLLLVGSVSASTIDGIITPNPQYAFGENLGWINFACDNCDVHITDTGLTGYAWSPQYGWINLAPDGSGVTNNCSGELGGKAWSKTLGWVDFSGAIINATGEFTGLAGTPGDKAGRVNFSCDNCGVSTDWLQCALRESPAQVLVNSITDNTIPSISANISVKNEGLTSTEYLLEWCVVSDSENVCGGGDDTYYSCESKLIEPGETWTDDKTATVPIAGDYYFKLIVHYGENSSSASRSFSAETATVVTPPSGGGGGGGGGGSSAPTTPAPTTSVGADFNGDGTVNSIDFSILLAFWQKKPPFKNPAVDANQDGRVDSIDFSILMYNWGRKI